MGWFDEQVRLRNKSDQEMFEDSIFNMASSVIGRSTAKTIDDKRYVSKKAVEEIIKYYGFKVKPNISDSRDVLKYYGISYRSVRLKGKWHNDAYGPMLGYVGEEKRPVALLPGKRGGYTYYDYALKKTVRISSANIKDIDEQAYCFYKPLPQKKLSVIDLVRYLLGCIDNIDVLAYIGLAALTTLFGLMLTQFNAFIAGYVLDSRSMALLVGTAMFLLTTLMASQVIEACVEMAGERMEIKSSLNVQAAVMARVIDLPTSFFKDFTSGELASRIDAVSTLCTLLVENFFSIPVVVALSLFYFREIGHFAPALVVPSLAMMISSLIVSLITTFINMRINEKVMAYDAHEDGISYALINGVQKIKLAGAERRAFAKWANDYNDSAQLLYSPPLFVKISSAINLAVTVIGTAVLYYVAVKTGVKPNEYIAFTTAFGLVEAAFNRISTMAISASQIRPIIKLAEPILTAEPESNQNKQIVDRLSGNIELNNVFFKYGDGPYVLNGINLKIKAGEYVAIVGKTGCGKSTLLRLLLGFETPEKGAVYYDSKNIERLDLKSLRRKIGTVTQNGSLFQGDIYSNIVISAPNLSVNDAWEAAEIAGIADDIRQMPMGMFTYISEGQGGISGGQKQRLMIARAVAPKPSVLFLDEATSALDNITQKRVSEALDGLKCTRLVIAHRLSTIKNCDRIVVIDGGKIVEDGKYDDLLARGGYFAELVKRQQV